jgi:hypothetical protein
VVEEVSELELYESGIKALKLLASISEDESETKLYNDGIKVLQLLISTI